LFATVQIKFVLKSSLGSAAKYEVKHSEKTLEFPTLYAVPATCIN
jgi:hypothetical protein